MTVWCLTTSPCNFARTAELGWSVQGIKRRRRRTAEQIAPGDKIVYYVSQVVAFGALAEVTSAAFEDHERQWTATKPNEDYPWRFGIRPELVLDEPRWVPVAEIAERLAFPRRWPAEHWRLAFQGNIRGWPEEDYEVVRGAMLAARPSTSVSAATATVAVHRRPYPVTARPWTSTN